MDLYNTHILPLATTGFMTFCRYYNIAKQWFYNIYITNAVIRMITDDSHWAALHLYYFIINQKVEPDSVPWLLTSTLVPDHKSLVHPLRLVETYAHNYASVLNADIFDQADKTKYDTLYISKICKELVADDTHPIVICKKMVESESEDASEPRAGYIIRRGGFSYTNLEFTPSAAQFLSVEYSHPVMDTAVGLTVDSAWLYAGNELFTPAFVLRLLDYQSIAYYFDLEYTVKIMDSECNILTLTADNFMLLTTEGYEIKPSDDSLVLVDKSDK